MYNIYQLFGQSMENRFSSVKTVFSQCMFLWIHDDIHATLIFLCCRVICNFWTPFYSCNHILIANYLTYFWKCLTGSHIKLNSKVLLTWFSLQFPYFITNQALSCCPGYLEFVEYESHKLRNCWASFQISSECIKRIL